MLGLPGPGNWRKSRVSPRRAEPDIESQEVLPRSGGLDIADQTDFQKERTGTNSADILASKMTVTQVEQAQRLMLKMRDTGLFAALDHSD